MVDCLLSVRAGVADPHGLCSVATGRLPGRGRHRRRRRSSAGTQPVQHVAAQPQVRQIDEVAQLGSGCHARQHVVAAGTGARSVLLSSIMLPKLCRDRAREHVVVQVDLLQARIALPSSAGISPDSMFAAEGRGTAACQTGCPALPGSSPSGRCRAARYASAAWHYRARPVCCPTGRLRCRYR